MASLEVRANLFTGGQTGVHPWVLFLKVFEMKHFVAVLNAPWQDIF
jgi:hypothetical protein